MDILCFTHDKLVMEIAIQYTNVIFLIIASLLGVYFFVKYRNIERVNNEKGVHLTYQREVLEERLHSIESQIAMDGSRFADTNHLLLKENYDDSYNDGLVPNFRFFTSLGIDLQSVEVLQNSIACIMPFMKKQKTLFDQIQQACKERGYECLRTDRTYDPDNILKNILDLITKSRFIIAVLDGRNPNVYYELGICHALGKKVIMVANGGLMDKIPYDLMANKRIVFYNTPLDLKEKLSVYLKQLPDAYQR